MRIGKTQFIRADKVAVVAVDRLAARQGSVQPGVAFPVAACFDVVEEEVPRRLAAAAAVGVIKEAAVQVFVIQPGIQSAAVLAQVGDGGGFVGKQVAQGQGALPQISDDAVHAVRQAGTRQWPVAPVFSGGQVTELVGIENTAGVTVR